jgi:hypothetical protein
MLVGAEIPRQKTALASEELKTIIATSTTHICSRFRMDGPRLELQISKFILLDALVPGNWLGAQSEESSHVWIVAEAEKKTYRCTVCPQTEADQDRTVNTRCDRGRARKSEECGGQSLGCAGDCEDERSSATPAWHGSLEKPRRRGRCSSEAFSAY